MYKKFYFYKSLINILLIGLLLILTYLDKDIVPLLIITTLAELILFILKKYKFSIEQNNKKYSYNISSGFIILTLLWLGRDFNKVFILVALVLFIVIELEEYKNLK